MRFVILDVKRIVLLDVIVSTAAVNGEIQILLLGFHGLELVMLVLSDDVSPLVNLVVIPYQAVLFLID